MASDANASAATLTNDESFVTLIDIYIQERNPEGNRPVTAWTAALRFSTTMSIDDIKEVITQHCRNRWEYNVVEIQGLSIDWNSAVTVPGSMIYIEQEDDEQLKDALELLERRQGAGVDKMSAHVIIKDYYVTKKD